MLKKKDNNDTQFAKIKSIIGQDAIFEGTLQAKETTRVDGLIKGDVKIDTVLVLGLTGKIVGNVRAATIMIGGTVEGDLIATDKITISGTGKVTGNLHTKKLVVDENAVFFGQCFMGDEVPALESQAPLKAAEAPAASPSSEYRKPSRPKAAEPGEYPKSVRPRPAEELRSAGDEKAAGE
ncbi:MAG: polymer-forming cytoskeletal protein [Lachnospiraceae bacterium]|jgi:cytoskeletal protein CcmA (bactofilin family)|nr:polymer-forming cytoskeletal protein [Lachnospiraceae bacterium]